MNQVITQEQNVDLRAEKDVREQTQQLFNTEKTLYSEPVYDDMQELQTRCFVLGYN